MANSKPTLSKPKQELVTKILEELKNGNLIWRKPWKSENPYNAASGKKYTGINFLILSLQARDKDYKDPRWMTFNQMKSYNEQKTDGEQLHLKAGSKGTPISFCAYYDRKLKRNWTTEEVIRNADNLNELIAEKQVYLNRRVYFVFNAEQFDGFPPLENTVNPDLTWADSLELAKNMNLEMIVRHSSEAYYSPKLDHVVLPEATQFVSQQEMNMTSLHEMAHATMHPSRLNRDVQHSFGTSEYALEELRAELTAVIWERCLAAFLNRYSATTQPILPVGLKL